MEHKLKFCHFVAKSNRTLAVICTLTKPTQEKINNKLTELQEDFPDVVLWITNDDASTINKRLKQRDAKKARDFYAM